METTTKQLELKEIKKLIYIMELAYKDTGMFLTTKNLLNKLKDMELTTKEEQKKSKFKKAGESSGFDMRGLK